MKTRDNDGISGSTYQIGGYLNTSK